MLVKKAFIVSFHPYYLLHKLHKLRSYNSSSDSNIFAIEPLCVFQKMHQ